MIAHRGSSHHSISVDYDSAQPATLNGRVTRVDWRNPHAFFYIANDHPSTSQEKWAIELGSINSLKRLGWTQNTLKVGTLVNVQGILAIDGRKMMNARLVTVLAT